MSRRPPSVCEGGADLPADAAEQHFVLFHLLGAVECGSPAALSVDLRLDDNFLVQFSAYVDYLITENKTTTITKLFFNSGYQGWL